MAITSKRISFTGSQGEELSARLDLPLGPPRAYALFAHCFSCSKDIFAAARISRELAQDGIAVLRFDFTGLGNSDGDFANTNFSSNVADLLAAANFLREEFQAPKLLIGHSLGGAAVIMAASDIPEAKAVVTLAAPADVTHVENNFAEHITEIEEQGKAEVKLGGRPFTIKKQFLDDLKAHKVTAAAKQLKRALLIMHAPLDQQVGIDNATDLFIAAKHPKSFVSLDNADHLITGKEDALYAAGVICAWATRYIGDGAERAHFPAAEPGTVVVKETGQSKWENIANLSGHPAWGDQPGPVGGDRGPAPYDYVAMGLGLCTNQTLRMYAKHKGVEPGPITTTVTFAKVHLDDCEDCARGKDGKTLTFTRRIHIPGDLDDGMKERMLELADRCPVHIALEGKTPIKSELVD